MFIEVIKRDITTPSGRFVDGKQFAVLQCDHCNKQWQVENPWRYRKKVRHYCSRQCCGSDPFQRERNRVSNLKAYEENREAILEKIRTTIREHHGVDYYSQSTAWHEQVTSGSLEHWGTEWPSQSEAVKDKIEKTCYEHFGVPSALQATHVRKAATDGWASGTTKAKRDATTLERYGTSNVSATSEMKKRIRDTCLAKYGIASTLLLPDAVRKARENSGSVEACAKAHATMKRNGTYRTSIPEKMCHEKLIEMFGKDEIVVQKTVHKWPIDFYVVPLDTYVQVDGVYWHGLDRLLSVIEESSSPRDKIILRKRVTDSEQNVWFADRGMKLVRVTDELLKQDPDILRTLLFSVDAT